MSGSPLDAEDLRGRVQKVLDATVAAQTARLEEISDDLAPLAEAVAALLSGGKRLRAAFCYWGWRGAGGADGEPIVRAAACLELLHACALIHDDVMDGSDTRRGAPAVHRRFAQLHESNRWLGSAERFGSGAAILLGDLCLAWADELLLASGLTERQLLAAKPVYDLMRTELMAGQYLDLLEQSIGTGSTERATRVLQYKSAKYTVERPLHLGGAAAGGASGLLQAYSAFGLPLGEAFQLRDDLLGVFGDPEQTGKPAGDDLREGKRTVLVNLAVQQTDDAGRALLLQALGGGPGPVDELREVITASGAVQQVEEMISARTAEAVRALATAPVAEPARRVLRELALAATDRTG